MLWRGWQSVEHVLITCFEPFGGRGWNASFEAVAALPNAVGPFGLYRLCLPVEFGRAAELARAAMDGIHPSAVICVGEAAQRDAITPEMVALNLRYARIPDNAGYQPLDEPVVAGGENALFSTLPVRAMAEAIRAAGLPAEVSYSAGTYVCNDLFYLLLHHLHDSGVPAGFIHVPADGPLTAEQIAAGLKAAIGTLG